MQQRRVVTVVLLRREERLRRIVREIAGRDDVRQRRAELAADAAALGQMRLDERAMLPAELAVRIQGFDDAGSLSPPASRARGEADDGDGTGLDGFSTDLGAIRIDVARRVNDILVADVLDRRGRGEAVLGEADAAAAHVGADALVLFAVEAEFVEERAQRLLGCAGFLLRLRKKPV